MHELLGAGHDLATNGDERSPLYGHCWFCVRNSSTLHYTNGLDLCLKEERDDRDLDVTLETTYMNKAALAALDVLKKEHGPLSPLEEALISRVTAVTSVLTLPAGGQLGYRGNCINFVNDNAAIARQLPRAVSETGLIFYVTKGTDKADGSEVARLRRVRRAAVRDWLKFLADHH